MTAAVAAVRTHRVRPYLSYIGARRTAARALAAFAAVLGVLLSTAAAARAAQPVLEPIDLPNSIRERSKATLRLRYTDRDGDSPVKAQFIDRSASSSSAGTEVDVTRKGAGDPETGLVLEWDVSNLEVGSHRSYFEVTNDTGEVVRYPANDQEFYGFTVESLTVKLGIMAGGLVVGLVFLPFLVYVLARSMNKRGDPSRAARVGLLIGILACGALFIYLFASFYGPLVFAIGIIASLALAVIVLTRR